MIFIKSIEVPCIIRGGDGGYIDTIVKIGAFLSLAQSNSRENSETNQFDGISVEIDNIDAELPFTRSSLIELTALNASENVILNVSRSCAFGDSEAVSLTLSTRYRKKISSFIDNVISIASVIRQANRISAAQFFHKIAETKQQEKIRPLFKQFSLQELAFQYFDHELYPMLECKVFSYESIQSGKRMFLLSDCKTFVKEYMKIAMKDRHVYEIIREGFPCRPYFDLEFSIPSNPELDGDALTVKLIHLLIWKLYELYDLPVEERDAYILESITAEKYSLHLTFILRDGRKELLLANNIEAGKLLKAVVMDTTVPVIPLLKSNEVTGDEKADDNIIQVYGECRAIRKEFNDLWVWKKDGKQKSKQRTFFADLGVYTKNRAFRILGSCKFGKTAAFRVAEGKFGFNSLNNKLPLSSSFADRLQHNLATYLVVPFDLFLSSVDGNGFSETEKEKKSFEKFSRNFNTAVYGLLPPTTEDGSEIYGVFGPMGRIASNRFSSNDFAGIDTEWADKAPKRARIAHAHWDIVATASWKGEASWFPQLDEYMTATAASVGGVRGVLHSWSLSLSSRRDFPVLKMRYQVQRNRWCGNIGRAHRSNGIYLEVDLMNREWSQCCFDADCRGYRSPPCTVPSHVSPSMEELQAIIEKHRSQNAHCD